MTEAQLETRLVFIDTNAYEAKNFQFDAYELGRLKAFIDDGNIQLLISTITISEIKKHLSAKAIAAASVIKRAKQEAMILRNLPDHDWAKIFTSHTADDIEVGLQKKFDDFLRSDHIEVITSARADSEAVFTAYFAGEPPFAGPGKKTEFPDAFALDAVNRISVARGHKVYVVSAENGFKEFCLLHENMIALNGISELVNLIVRNTEELAKPAVFADKIFQLLENDINARVGQSLEEVELTWNDFYDEDVEITEVVVDECAIHSKSVIDVTKESAEYEINFKVALKVEYLVTDYDRSPWDSEDKKYVWLETSTVVKRFNGEISAIVDIAYDDGIEANAEILSVDMDDLLDLSKFKDELIARYEND